MNQPEKTIDELLEGSEQMNTDLTVQDIIISFSCRFSLEKVAFSDEEGFADHNYQLNAELYRDTVLVTYRAAQHNETVPSLTFQSIVDKSFMNELDRIISESDVRKYNGMHRHTAGLPEGYGCSLEVRYLFGKQISLSNNSFLYFSVDFVQQLIRLFYRYSGAMVADAGNHLNGVSYRIIEGGMCTFQAYLLLNQDESVALEYYDRKNFRTLTRLLSADIFDELEELWKENDLEYAGKPDMTDPDPCVCLDLRFGKRCCSVRSSSALTAMQRIALESVRDIIDSHLNDPQPQPNF